MSVALDQVTSSGASVREATCLGTPLMKSANPASSPVCPGQ